jgi:hypothetical protein
MLQHCNKHVRYATLSAHVARVLGKICRARQERSGRCADLQLKKR